jgi:tetratricopeptide (TPR) repeat protein
MYYADAGDAGRAVVQHLEAVEAYLQAGDRHREALARRNVAAKFAELGRYAEAQARHEHALAAAEAIGDQNMVTTNRFDLAYVYWCEGQRARGREMGERLLAELREAGQSPLGLANCLAVLGIILLDAGETAEAAGCFAEAHALWQAHSVDGAWIEVEALEARAVLALGRRDEAARLASEVWAFLQEHGAVRIDYPSRVYVCIADVVAQVENPWVAEREVLETAHRLLMQRAEMIENTDWRRSFLENEVSNRVLLARCESVKEAA